MASDPALTADAHRLENEFYVVEIHAFHGGITRIFDKELGVELLDSSMYFGNELRSPEDPTASSRDSEARIELTESGPLRATTTVTSRIAEVPYRCNISLARGVKRVDFDLTIDYGSGYGFGTHRLSLDIPNFPDMAGAKVLMKDGAGLYASFPVAFGGELHINQPFGIYQTAKKDQFTLDFADVYQGEYGFCLIHRNTPGYYYEDDVLSVTLSQGKPLVAGTQGYQYSVYSHAGDPYASNVFAVAQSRFTPLEARWPERTSGRLSPEASFVSIDRDNIVLSALFAEGDTLYARLYEISGSATSARIGMPWVEAAASHTVTLGGEQREPLAWHEGHAQVEFGPWEIVTIALEKPRALP